MPVRSGAEFIEGLRKVPREVWANGRRITDVAADPLFARPVQAVADLYDLQCAPEHRDVMVHHEPGGEAYGMSFMIPRSHADLVQRRRADLGEAPRPQHVSSRFGGRWRRWWRWRRQLCGRRRGHCL